MSSKLPSGTGISSTVPSSSAAGFATSTPTYSATAPAKKGSYGLAPQPTSSSRGRRFRPAASAASSRSQRASGARTAYVGERSCGCRRPSPGSATSGESKREPGQCVERDPGHDSLRDPETRDGERPEQGDHRCCAPEAPCGEPHGAQEDGGEQQESDDAEIRQRLHVEVLNAVAAGRGPGRKPRPGAGTWR